MKHPIVRTAALAGVGLAAMLMLPAGAQMRPQGAALPAPGVMRIPASAAVSALTVNPNAPIRNGEFSTPIRTPADRMTMAAQIRQQRAAENARFATGAGPGVAVQLRRSRY